jgi:beta-mannanase
MNKKIETIVFFVVLVLLYACGGDEDYDYSGHSKAEWIENAFASFESNQYPKVKAISWWNEAWEGTNLKINSSTESLEAYRSCVSSSTFVTVATISGNKLIEPNAGIYHAAFPDFGGEEDIVTAERIDDFETQANKDIVWAYFSNNWRDNIQFPSTEVNTINGTGKIPFIRIMPRTGFDEGGTDPNYSMQKIINGDFDAALTQWAINASNTGIPLLAEFGTEVNGNWFPWNGQYNGGGETTGYGDAGWPDGPERFRDAYQHIIDICDANGADNITWFFHVDAYSVPEVNWNEIENYYPGDNYIDWLGVSVYGLTELGEEYMEFSEILDNIYTDLSDMSDNPIAILEFGMIDI